MHHLTNDKNQTEQTRAEKAAFAFLALPVGLIVFVTTEYIAKNQGFTAETSLKISAILTFGVLFCGNFFSGSVLSYANKLVDHIYKLWQQVKDIFTKKKRFIMFSFALATVCLIITTFWLERWNINPEDESIAFVASPTRTTALSVDSSLSTPDLTPTAALVIDSSLNAPGLTPTAAPTSIPTSTPFIASVALSSPMPDTTFTDGNTIRMEWNWDLLLQANQTYDVLFWQEHGTPRSIANTKNSFYDYAIRGGSLPPGIYYWSVRVIELQGQTEVRGSKSESRRLNISE